MKKMYIPLQEVVIQRDIDKLIRNLRFLTKNIRNIKNGRDLYDAKMGYAKLRDDMEKFFYGNIIGIMSKTGKHDVEQKHHDAMHNLTYGSFFSPRIGNSTYWVDEKYKDFLDKNTSRDKPIPYNPDYHQEIYELWNKDRDYHYQKLGKTIRGLTKMLEYFLAYYEGEIPEKAKTIYHKIGSVSIEIITDETEDTLLYDARVKEFIGEVKSSIDLINEFPTFSQALKNLDLRYDAVDIYEQRYANSLVAGYYMPSDDYIAIRTLGIDAYTILHEIGHRYYHKFLPKEYQEMWEARLEDNYVELTPEITESIQDAFWTAYDKEGYEDKNNFKYLGSEMIVDILNHFKDPHMKDVFVASTEVVGYKFGVPFNFPKDSSERDEATYGIDLYIKFLKEEKRINMMMVSGYGNTNPKEAYADCFSYYILKGKWKGKIPDEMLSMFSYIS